MNINIKNIAILLILILSKASIAKQSQCYGTSKHGRLDDGVQLPSSGKNFTSSGKLPEFLGRNYVHSLVKTIILESYQELSISQAGKVFKYAETGFKSGGEFKPHKTHQNGLSVDFMVPVLDKNNKSVVLPTNFKNKYGYAIEFNNKGINKHYKIDFEAMAAHILALDKAAKKHGVALWRVIFAPDLQKQLYATKNGKVIKSTIKIPTKKSWVRHDEHYHVDFAIPCKSSTK